MLNKYNMIRLAATLLALAICLCFRLTQVVGVSMLPTLHDGDVCVYTIPVVLHRGDIVIINSDELKEYIIKRVVAIPGDTVYINNGDVYVNDELLDEPYITNPAEYHISKLTVPKNSVFVLGDNRAESTDSRQLGSLSLSDVIGKYAFNLTNVFGIDASYLRFIYAGIFVFLMLVLTFIMKLFTPKKELM